MFRVIEASLVNEEPYNFWHQDYNQVKHIYLHVD